MIMLEGVPFRQYISQGGIQVDLEQMEVILNFPTLTMKRDVRSLLSYVIYYRRFIKEFRKKVGPLYTLLEKYLEFYWTTKCVKGFM